MSKVSRRAFIAGVAVAGAGACVYGLGGCSTFTKIGKTPAVPSGAYVIENDKVKIDLLKAPDFAKVGGSAKIIDSRLPQSIIVARTGETEFLAVSLKCPHRGVEVEYKHAEKQFRCASIGHSTFGTDGARKKGFAKHSLTRFDAQLDPAEKNRLVITLPEVR